VEIGAYYTNGQQLAEVVKVYGLGHIMLRDSSTEEWLGFGISAFRRDWWRVR
jgi:hypothetical protein